MLAIAMTRVAPSPSTAQTTAQADRMPHAPLFQQAAGDGNRLSPLIARDKSGRLYDYEPTGTGGFGARFDLGGGYANATAMAQVNISQNSGGTDLYVVIDDTLFYTSERGNDTKVLGTGWGAYNLLVSVGNMGGTGHPDLFARDATGQLWFFQGKPDGSLAPRIRVGTGWNGMDELTGRGDYTGDGKADLVARSAAGGLYIYPGTGSLTADAIVGARLTVAAPAGAASWKDYSALVSVGDNDGDGKPDLIGVEHTGVPADALWLFKGTGKSAAPFASRRLIDSHSWGSYNLLF
ncbi:FG-GAP repeat domain-containing protein [Streptomyces sp. NPDC102395]|uniref:FG-GAP repeat domain-containing protein n=1 Tax=Streptomyces sp. NPDC102395 TaxID=3366168 RepID=UPI0038226850